MPIKVNFLLGIMIAAAVLVVLGFFINVKGINRYGANILKLNEQTDQGSNLSEENNKNKMLKSDIDKDGLFDEEESIYRTDPLNPDTDKDGFLDGEEVLSGHDPTIPGPNDLFLFLNENLTERFAALTMSGLHEGSLKSDNPDFDKSINAMVSSVLLGALDSLSGDLNLKNFDLEIVDSNKVNQENYIKNLSELYENLFNLYLIETKDFLKKLEEIDELGFGNRSVKNYYSDKGTQFQNIYDQLSSMQVPENWKSNHLNLLALSKKLAIINLTIASGKNDPIKAMIALNRLIEVADELAVLTNSYVEKVKDLSLGVKSTIFQK